MKNFEPIPVFKRDNIIQNDLGLHENRISYFQVVVNKYNEIENLPSLNEGDLKDLIDDPKTFLVKKITNGEKVTIGNHNLSDDKIFDFIDLPTGVKELVLFIENLKTSESDSKFYYRHAELYCIVNGMVEVSKSELDRIDNAATIFLKNEKEKGIYDLLTAICESTNKLMELQHIYHIDDAMFKTLLVLDNVSGKVSINIDFLNIVKV